MAKSIFVNTDTSAGAESGHCLHSIAVLANANIGLVKREDDSPCERVYGPAFGH